MQVPRGPRRFQLWVESHRSPKFELQAPLIRRQLLALEYSQAPVAAGLQLQDYLSKPPEERNLKRTTETPISGRPTIGG
jgi:hypothetical protein